MRQASEILRLVRLMQRKHESYLEPYVLLIGAGASIASGCSSTLAIMREIVLQGGEGAGLQGDGDLKRQFNEIWRGFSPSERCAAIRPHLDRSTPSPGYRWLALLMKMGYFPLVLSTNFDLLLEQSLHNAQLQQDKDYARLINGKDQSDYVLRAVHAQHPPIKIIKLHGDLAFERFAFTPEETWEFDQKFESVLTEYLNRDLIVVGNRVQDHDLTRCMRRGENSIWYIAPECPTDDTSAGQIMSIRRATFIKSDFDEFFSTLYQGLTNKVVLDQQPKTVEEEKYLAGVKAMNCRAWEMAIRAFDDVMASDHDYGNAAFFREICRKRIQVAQMIDEGRLQDARKSTANLLSDLGESDPTYSDTKYLLASLTIDERAGLDG